MWFISAEDLVIAKLLWAKDSHSEFQLRDVANLLKAHKDIDTQYISDWVKRMNLIEVYNKVKNV